HLGVNDIVLRGTRAGRTTVSARSARRARTGPAGLVVGRGLVVQRRAGLLGDGHQLLVRVLDLLHVRAAERGPAVAERLVDLVTDVGRDLVAVLREELLGLPLQRLGQVARLGLLTAAAVLVGVLLRVAHHPLDVILRQRRAAGDGHRLLLARA